MVHDLDYKDIEFPDYKISYCKIYIYIYIYICLQQCFAMNINWLTLFMYQMKNLRTVWTYWWEQKKISPTMSLINILTDLCAIRQKIEIRNTFKNITYNALVAKNSCRNTKKLVSK